MLHPDDNANALFDRFGDLFGDLFGHRVPPTSRDGTQRVVVSLERASEGGEQELQLARFVACDECHGRGGPEDATRTACADCGGTGGTHEERGLFVVARTCRRCTGRGGEWDRVCARCAGARGAWRSEELRVVIPPGIGEGQRLRLSGKGHDLDGTGPGDLYLVVVTAPHPRFTRDGADLATRVEIGRELAAGGGTAKVALLYGQRSVAVPPGTRSGQQTRLRGCGMVRYGAPAVPLPAGDEQPYRSVDPSEHRGDLVVTFVVEGDPLPEDLLEPEELEVRDDARSDRRFRLAAAAVGVILVAAWLCVRLVG